MGIVTVMLFMATRSLIDSSKRQRKMKSNKGKRNNKSAFVCGLYSMSQSSSNDWIIDS